MKLSNKEKAMFLAVGIKEAYIDHIEKGQVGVLSLYHLAVEHCFMAKVPESDATESLRRCFDAIFNERIFRGTPAFEDLITL